MSHVNTVVFPVAGLGTRFLPFTKSVPKEMLPLIDKPLIQYAVEEARAAGIRNFVLVSSPCKPALDDFFRRNHRLEAQLESAGKERELQQLKDINLPSESFFLTHQNDARGLGHAIWTARAFLRDGPFAVILPDDFIHASRPAIGQMIQMHGTIGGNMVATMGVIPEAISAYGCLDVEARAGRCLSASGVVEKPDAKSAPSNFAVIGRYILQPSVLDQLGHAKTGVGGEIQLTDAIAADSDRNMLWGYEFEGRWFDCGSKKGFVAATLALAMDCEDLSQIFTDTIRASPKAA